MPEALFGPSKSGMYASFGTAHAAAKVGHGDVAANPAAENGSAVKCANGYKPFPGRTFDIVGMPAAVRLRTKGEHLVRNPEISGILGVLYWTRCVVRNRQILGIPGSYCTKPRNRRDLGVSYHQIPGKFSVSYHHMFGRRCSIF